LGNQKDEPPSKPLLLFLLSLLGPGCALRVHVHTALQGVQAPVSDWYNAPDRWQIQYVAAIVDAGNSTGIRCPGTVTVGAIRYELLTRVNQGRIQGTDLVYDQIQKILSEAGCVTNTGTKIVPLQVVPREAAAPIVVPPQPVPTINAEGKRIPAGLCENLVARSAKPETFREYGCPQP
jgi:hypothetical protein